MWKKYIATLDESKNTSKFWRYAKMMAIDPEKKKSYPPLTIPDGSIVDDHVDKANVILEQFCPTHENPAATESSDLITYTIQEGILRHEPHMLNQTLK